MSYNVNISVFGDSTGMTPPIFNQSMAISGTGPKLEVPVTNKANVRAKFLRIYAPKSPNMAYSASIFVSSNSH